MNPKLIEAKGTRLLRDQRVRGDPAEAQRRGGSTNRPAESECQKRKSSSRKFRELPMSQGKPKVNLNPIVIRKETNE
ncbi:hypothetical protein [Heyndrickxia acidicola]|uniref:Uncharacterized protein n=1 Tax=Heyndrickxia acidicola TaxID=209389 RepID=A0ABU6MLX9_9BACI|nr:hypothetical protein [Heyndrickxia acidicola]MED1205304.1 hypothetical protein [Heyndrickxia acidicola]